MEMPGGILFILFAQLRPFVVPQAMYVGASAYPESFLFFVVKKVVNPLLRRSQ